ncbi:MAG TPA: type II toxin-antitoxin system HicB family antitoxin [Chloroflexota bacterium]|nr:type II toxin-antitoxin system HicB family antitoxin [Chloroflexota bacterium]
MLTEYVDAALKHAEYKRLDDGEWFGEIPPTPGVWATGTTVEETRTELRSVLEDWILIGLHKGEALPVIDGIDLNTRSVA